MIFKIGYETMIGLRYTRSRSRNNFVSFISAISMIGIALGVASLIVVLSVMNGFQIELRERILGVVSHVQIRGYGEPIANWADVARRVESIASPVGMAPFTNIQGLLSKSDVVKGVMVRGIDPTLETKVSILGHKIIDGSLDSLQSGKFNIVLGVELAQRLQVGIGDKVLLMIPKGQTTPAGIIPRLKRFEVSGVFEAGMYDYDSGLALIALGDSQTLTRSLGLVDGLRLKLEDLFLAPNKSRLIAESLQVDNLLVTDWTQSHANFFRAVQIEKKVMFVILMLVVAVAAFNIVSTLVMAVADKRSDIAILRTLGASPKGIMVIFVLQGALIGFIGASVGVILGVLVAVNIDVIVPFMEAFLGVDLLSKDVYYISELPSELKLKDVVFTAFVSFVLSILATIYPSWRASKTRPAEALRYE